MDGVEIVMGVEDAFDISIEDAEAEKILTPGQLIDLVASKVATTNTDVCLTHRSFNLLRRFLVRRCGLPRKQVRPDTRLATTIPWEQRRPRLTQLSAELAIESHPELVRPEWLKATLCALTVGAGLTAAGFLFHANHPASNPMLPVITMLLVMIAIGYFGAVATKAWRNEFPKKLRTVGDLARWIMTHKPDLAVAEASKWTRDQIAARVREIVVDVLACEAAYRENAHFIQDLGLS